MNNRYQTIKQKYEKIGIQKGVELLLLPEDAIKLIDDLVEIGVRLLGCDCWRYVDIKEKDTGKILEIVGGGVIVELPENSLIIDDANYVKEFISNKLYEDVNFVSLIYDEPE